MMDLYDIHCHILPGLDDGAKDELEMIKMVQIAYKEGIRTIIATPHYHPYRGLADAEAIVKNFGKAYRLIKSLCPEMDLYEGNEIYYQNDIIKKIKEGEILTIANSRYALIEFSTDADFRLIKDAVEEILFAGFSPIIAHVERYNEMMKNLDRVNELVETGAYMQVNADSCIGNSGAQTKKDVRKLLKRDLVHFVGTDAHDQKDRAPYMRKCVYYIEKKFGEERAKRIFQENPSLLIQDKII